MWGQIKEETWMLIWGNKWKAGRSFVRECVCKWVCEWVHQCLASRSVCTACFISCGTKMSPPFLLSLHHPIRLPSPQKHIHNDISFRQHTSSCHGSTQRHFWEGGVAWLTHSDMRPTNPLTPRSIDICTARCSVCKAFKDIGWLHVWPFTWPGLFSVVHYSLNCSHPQCTLALSIVFLTVLLKLCSDSGNLQYENAETQLFRFVHVLFLILELCVSKTLMHNLHS